MAGARGPRAVGRRVDYGTLPASVRGWVEGELGGRVVGSVTQVGGMSSGPASRLILDDGRRAFVKAVSIDPNPHTPMLFRHEIAVLGRLPAAAYRPALLAAYDDGEWVALLLEDVEGRHPDLDQPGELDAVRMVVRDQLLAVASSARGFSIPGEDMADKIGRWHHTIAAADATMRTGLPAWWRSDEDELMSRIDGLGRRIATAAWCHLDIRDDNLLIRPDGRAAILDWGMSCAGPSWLDELLLDLHVVDRPEFDELVPQRPAYPDSDDLEQDTTDALLALGSSLAVMAEGPPPRGLPWIGEFRRREARRILAGARRRLRR